VCNRKGAPASSWTHRLPPPPHHAIHQPKASEPSRISGLQKNARTKQFEESPNPVSQVTKTKARRKRRGGTNDHVSALAAEASRNLTAWLKTNDQA
jgi:hypothetical protein